jgi:hypothetical protein
MSQSNFGFSTFNIVFWNRDIVQIYSLVVNSDGHISFALLLSQTVLDMQQYQYYVMAWTAMHQMLFSLSLSKIFVPMLYPNLSVFSLSSYL